jgi:hypothetical protein
MDWIKGVLKNYRSLGSRSVLKAELVKHFSSFERTFSTVFQFGTKIELVGSSHVREVRGGFK